MLDLDVIEDPAAAAAALDPVRARILAGLAQPDSAAGLAARLGLPRQKVTYHLKALERHGLVRPAGERKWGGITERRLVASAAGYVVSDKALGPAAPRPEQSRDRLSAGHLVALAARAVREVGALMHKARAQDKRLATLSLDAEIRFRSPAERAAFAEDLTQAVAALAAKYHDTKTDGGRLHRLVLLAHPAATEEDTDGGQE